jgi:hypothetical protein
MWISESTRIDNANAVPTSLALWLSHAETHGPLARGVFVRRRYLQLETVQVHAASTFPDGKAFYDRGSATWTFSNGASLKIRHVFDSSAAQEFRGQEFSMIIIGNTHDWPDDSVRREMSLALHERSDVPSKIVSFHNA